MTNEELFEDLKSLITIMETVSTVVCCTEAIEEHVLVLLKEIKQANVNADNMIEGLSQFRKYIIKEEILSSSQKVELINQLHYI